MVADVPMMEHNKPVAAMVKLLDYDLNALDAGSQIDIGYFHSQAEHPWDKYTEATIEYRVTPPGSIPTNNWVGRTLRVYYVECIPHVRLFSNLSISFPPFPK
jgi:hypothetical protein